MVTWEIYLKRVYMYDKTLGPNVDPYRLQGPPGSSLAWIKVLW